MAEKCKGQEEIGLQKVEERWRKYLRNLKDYREENRSDDFFFVKGEI